MANVPATGDRNWVAVLKRVTDAAWFGRDVSGTAKAPDLLNNETLDCVNAAGTATVGVVKLNASNVTEFPNTSGCQFDALIFEGVAPALTAHAGGGQGSATALTAMINRVSTVATQGDSVALPAAVVGLAITVINKGANPMQVFGAGTDTINGIATATGISQGINTTAYYTCSVAGNWEVPITSLQSTTPQSLAASGAIPPHVGHTYVVTKAGVAALTLAAPTAGTDDGIEIIVTSSTANAHTLTATGLLQTGSASVNLATFAAQAGAGLTLMAFNAKWIVLSQIGITFS